jgi:hypothetical protein
MGGREGEIGRSRKKILGEGEGHNKRERRSQLEEVGSENNIRLPNNTACS